jgi:hypothetical protein
MNVAAPVAGPGLPAPPAGTPPEITHSYLDSAVRERRRTCLITLTSAATGRADEVRVCDPDRRDGFLLDLGLKGSGGGSAFRGHGQAAAHVAWKDTTYQVAWKRCRPSALDCDQCGDEWRSRPPRPRRELTEAQRRALEAHRFRGRG